MFPNIWQCKHFKPSESLFPKFISIVDSRKVDSRIFETILTSRRIYIYIYCNYHMYQFIPLHSCDYLKNISIKINVAIDEDNSRNEM